MVIVITDMEKLPENCAECNLKECKRPRKRDGQIKKPYLTQRHNFCELAELKPINPVGTAAADQ